MSNIIVCPSCKSINLVLIGNIPSSDSFAGRQLSFVISGENLYRCRDCHLHFRYPRLKQTDLNGLYQDAKPISWQYKKGLRQDWVLAEKWLNLFGSGKILDIGCWDGNFLTTLSDQWDKYGIEINKDAARRASDAGIKIIGEDVYQLKKNLSNVFDVVTAFDIIEHLEEPRSFLEQLLEYTRPGGYILVGTGNTDAWAWKIGKSRYWYCWNAEHITFVNKVWFVHQMKDMPFAILGKDEFVHHPHPSVLGLVLQSIANILYIYTPALFYKLRLLRWRLLSETGKKIVDHPPLWNMSKDHILWVLQKLP